jgi:diguanylate cyclase (GGDEF)-like protein/PAS domain S-box-containing protein
MPACFEHLRVFIRHVRARHLLVVCGLLIGLVLASAAIWFVTTLRQQDIDDTAREMENLALILAEETDRNFQAAELVQLGLIEHLRELGIDSPGKFERQMGSLEVHQDLRGRISGVSHIAALALVDQHGDLLNFTRSWPPPKINDADRDFVRDLLSPDALPWLVSGPLRSKSSGNWTIYLSRRLTAPDGQLIGIVVATIETAYFEQVFAKISLDAGASFVLYRRDGMLLARHPRIDDKIGRPFGRTRNFNLLVSAGDGGVVRLTSTLDGKERLATSHGVAHYPLLIAVTDTIDTVLRQWRTEVRVFAGTTALLELVIAASVLLGVRHLRNAERLVAAKAAQVAAEVGRTLAETELRAARERERAEQESRRHLVRFETALSNMLQALLMIDHAGAVLVVNRRFCELSGLPDGAVVPGMSYTELTELIVTQGNVLRDDLAVIRRRREELLGQQTRSRFIWELGDGRTIAVTHQPMEEGWLTTYEDITDRRAAEAQIAHLAHHDALTCLPNRVLFHEELDRALAFARRRSALALHYLDLDQFKAVNDTLGHPVGDCLLQAVAQRLQSGVREADTVARLGGDEFAIVQPAIESATDAEGLASRLIQLLQVPFEIGGQQIVIGASIGIAVAPQDGLDADQLMKCADLALYQSKSDGRGIHRLFRPEMDAAMQARCTLEADLRQALSAGQLQLLYQPLVDVRTRTVAGFEALLRWQHPTNGLVPPDRFIPLAEETGLIIPIGEWILGEACAAATRWPDRLKVAVNLSAAQFKSHNLIPAVRAALNRSGLDPGRLEIEITETVMLQDTEATLTTLHQVRQAGIQIAMDDFGTGYSSLSYLRRFPFDRIKIDQSFVRDLGKRADCIAIVRAVTALGNELGMAITAEGVETAQQLDTLERAGCTEAQGFLFSPAVPEGAVRGLVHQIACAAARHGRPAMAEAAE